MTEYVALLRGINVGGVRIAMAELRTEFEALAVTDVRTVLATGNVLFESGPAQAALLRPRIEAALTARFGYESVTFVYERAVVRAVADAYPFTPDRTDRHSYVVFVDDDTVHAELLAVAGDLDAGVEQIAGGVGVVYWEVVKSATTTSRFGRTLGRARFRATTTNRNLRTVRTIVG